MTKNINRGFTLAEVLITLSIIGVVAALTIPSLVVKNQEKETVVQLKKAYNVFSNVFSLAVVDYGDPSGWSWGTSNNGVDANNIMDKFAPYLNIIRRCNQDKGCFGSNVMYKRLDGGNWGIKDSDTAISKALLNDGMALDIYTYGGCTQNWGPGKLQNVCGSITVDLNGFKNPNQLGKDVFGFFITQEGIMPQGSPDDTATPLKTACKGGDGQGCTAWVLMKENLNYPDNGTDWDN